MRGGGGRREGAGRPRGSRNKRSRSLIARVEAEQLEDVVVLLTRWANDETQPLPFRAACAGKAAEFTHSKPARLPERLPLPHEIPQWMLEDFRSTAEDRRGRASGALRVAAATAAAGGQQGQADRLRRRGDLVGSLEEQNVKNFVKAIEQECFAPAADTGGSPTDKSLNAAGTFDFPTIIPVLGATCLLALGWVCTLSPQNFQPYNGGDFPNWFRQWVAPTNSPVIFAFLGAYFFSLQMIIKRFVRHDLGANAYNAISLRILLAIVGVWIATQTFKVFDSKFDETAPIVQIASFAVGAFPLVAWQLLTAALKKFPPFQAALPNLTCSQPLDAIDGLSYWAQVRLAEESIESVPNLATADLVDLMLNTKIPPHRIIDWVDQAILLTYLGTEEQRETYLGTEAQQAEHDSARSLQDKLKRYGIRTATGLEAAFRCCSTSGLLTRSLGDDQPDRLRSIVAAMRDCPNFVLIRNWRGIADDPEIEAAEESELNEALQYPKAT